MSLKIIAFPFAGGNKYSYNFLKEILSPEGVELITVEYPGRGKRVREPLLNTIEEVVDDIFVKMQSEIQKEDDFLIYGHSMGALVAYLVCQKLEQQSLKMPMKLIVSGAGSPCREEREKTYLLHSDEFWIKIDEMGGLPAEIIQDKALRSFFEPILRFDFQATNEYKYPGKSFLKLPIDVFYGSEEKITEEEILGWKNETTGVVNIKQLEGDHFFIIKHKMFFREYFTKLSVNLMH